MRAIRQIAIKKVAEKPVSTNLVAGPTNQSRRIVDKNVDVAKIAELNRIVRGRLLMSNVVQTPSSADIKMAAAPPYSNIVRKIKVSATVIRPLTLGILTAMRELPTT